MSGDSLGWTMPLKGDLLTPTEPGARANSSSALNGKAGQLISLLQSLLLHQLAADDTHFQSYFGGGGKVQ